MTEQYPFAIGTVAQEAARLIEDMATMARSSYSRTDDPGLYDGEPAQGPTSQDPPSRDTPPSAPRGRGSGAADDQAEDDRARRDRPVDAGGDSSPQESPAGACSVCGGESSATPASCKICPLCRGIALLRSVRPETVDLLADLALTVATSLRDVATRSRASDPASSSGSASGGRADGDHPTVQDIPVDDESEG